MKRLLPVLLISVFAGGEISRAGAATILPNDDIFVETSADGLTTTTYDGFSQSTQVNFGLAAANGVSTGRRRSYLEFTLGTETVQSATLRLYNYWGGPDVNGGQGRLPSGQIRVRGSLLGTPIQFDEPATSVVTDFTSPAEADFTTIMTTAAGAITNVGWFDFDITSWYNGRLGETTTLLLRGAATANFDFPLFEDREGTAFAAGAGGTSANSGPQIITVVPEPATLLLLPAGGLLLYCSRRKHRS